MHSIFRLNKFAFDHSTIVEYEHTFINSYLMIEVLQIGRSHINENVISTELIKDIGRSHINKNVIITELIKDGKCKISWLNGDLALREFIFFFMWNLFHFFMKFVCKFISFFFNEVWLVSWYYDSDNVLYCIFRDVSFQKKKKNPLVENLVKLSTN